MSESKEGKTVPQKEVLMFKSSCYQDISFSEWLTHTPPELVMAHLNVDKATLDAIPTDKAVILPR